MKVLLGVTGSVAAVKTFDLVTALTAAGYEVRVVFTDKARHFSKKLPHNTMYYFDKDEWTSEYKLHESPVLHIELREWADVLLIAPLSANTLAKIANGLADNLLTCVARAWNMAKPIRVAPAMNTEMWLHPATAEQLNKLWSWNHNFKIIHPVVKRLACGTEGIGAMAEIDTIVKSIEEVAACVR